MCSGCIAQALVEHGYAEKQAFVTVVTRMGNALLAGNSEEALRLREELTEAAFKTIDLNTELSAKYIDLLPTTVIEIAEGID